MTLEYADRVREQSTTTGTGSLALGGAVLGYQSFADAIGASNTCYYAAAHSTLNEWEVGLGTVATGPDTLARTTILASSNSGSAVNFSAGVKEVVHCLPASIFAALDPEAGVEGLDDLNDVVITSAANTHILRHNGTAWVNVALVAAHITDSTVAGRALLSAADAAAQLSAIGAAAATHTHTLSALTQSGATSGQVPTWNGTTWAPTTVSSGGATLPVDDTTALVRDPADNTKLVRIDAGSVATDTTRTITMPDRDVNLGSAVIATSDVGGGARTLHNGISSNGEIYLRTIAGQGGVVVTELGDGSLRWSLADVPLTAIDTTGATAGQVVKWNGTAVVWADDEEGTGGSGPISASDVANDSTLTGDTVADALNWVGTALESKVDSVNGDTGTVVVDLDSVIAASGSQQLPLTNLDSTGASAGDVITWNGTAYVLDALSGGGATNLDGLSDVVITSPATKHSLLHNGTNFINRLILSDDPRHGDQSTSPTLRTSLACLGRPYHSATLAGLKTDLWSWYPCDMDTPGATLNDVSGNGRNATSISNWIPSPTEFGLAQYSNSGRRGWELSSTSLRPGPNFTIAGWIKTPTSGSTSIRIIAAKGDGSGSFDEFDLCYMLDSAWKWRLMIRDSNGDPYNVNQAAAYDNIYNLNTWTFVCGWVDWTAGTGQMGIRVNASETTNTAVAGLSQRTATGHALTIGARTGSANGLGTIMNVGLWSRALSSTERAVLWNGGRPLKFEDLGS